MPEELKTTSFALHELTGEQHRLVLGGRALPYRGVKYTGTMRADVTWYPGYSVATLQLLGASEEPTTVTGKWKDRFIRGTDGDGNPVIPSGIAELDGAQVKDVMALVKTVDEFRRRGQLLLVSWDEIGRHGIISKFTYTFDYRTDVEWEIEFTWISQGEPEAPVAFTQEVQQTDLLSNLSAQFRGLLDRVNSPVFQLRQEFNRPVADATDRIRDAVASIRTTQRNVEFGISAPLDAAQGTQADLQTIAAQSGLIRVQTRIRPSRAQVNVDDPSSLTYGQALAQESFDRDVDRQARMLRYTSARTAQGLSSRTNQVEVLAVFSARESVDLRDVSTRFYNTPNEWKRIMTYNNLTSSRLSAGQFIYIPKLQATGG